MGVTQCRAGRISAYDISSVVTYNWELRRGINCTINLPAEHVISTRLNMIRRRIIVDWQYTGIGNRYTPVPDFATFEAWIDTLPEWCNVLIDPHTAPGFHLTTTTWADDVFWFDTDWHDNLIELYRLLGQRYGNHPVYAKRIAGYSLLNEPNCPSKNGKVTLYPEYITSAGDIPTVSFWNDMITAWNSLGWDGPSSPPTWNVGDRDPRSYKGLGLRCIAAIRESDRLHPIVYMYEAAGGKQSTGTNISMGPFKHRNHSPTLWYSISDINLVLAWHMYERPPYMLRGDEPPPANKGIIEGYLNDIKNFKDNNPTQKIAITEYGPTGPFFEGADQVLRWLMEIWEEWQVTALHHTLTFTGTPSDAALSESFLGVLKEFWLNNSTES